MDASLVHDLADIYAMHREHSQLKNQNSEMILIINEINRRDKRRRLGILEALQTHHVIDYDQYSII